MRKPPLKKKKKKHGETKLTLNTSMIQSLQGPPVESRPAMTKSRPLIHVVIWIGSIQVGESIYALCSDICKVLNYEKLRAEGEGGKKKKKGRREGERERKKNEQTILYIPVTNWFTLFNSSFSCYSLFCPHP